MRRIGIGAVPQQVRRKLGDVVRSGIARGRRFRRDPLLHTGPRVPPDHRRGR
ncbi:hypothetical protein [Saccharopolyspora sp. CA-218241]|uniref:hypothetical protein n=1 Tax=Saccharopolyspora sp. CA-218241 TaxID=3240027 RepID=UPI003D98040A